MLKDSSRSLLLSDSEVKKLQTEKQEMIFVDAFSRQIRELYLVHNPSLATKDKKLLYTSAEFHEYVNSHASMYTHVYYPWNNRLVKTVTEEDYFLLKTNRNQDLITSTEQRKLYDYRVAVFGLSVGSNIAFALTQAGISRDIVIADFDELDTTNLNRIFAGAHQIGLNKAVIAARRIYEDNPFANVQVFVKGIDTVSLEALLKKKQVNCVIDEVDDMRFKIEARKLAMKYRVPVLMITDNGDGIVLHVERYDIGHDKIFGKPVDSFQSSIETMTKEGAGEFIMKTIVGGPERVDPAMITSVKRVLRGELVSWSQLGSAALLGGVVATYMIKQIALKKNSDPDIRAYISPTSGTWSSHTS